MEVNEEERKTAIEDKIQASDAVLAQAKRDRERALRIKSEYQKLRRADKEEAVQRRERIAEYENERLRERLEEKKERVHGMIA